MFGQDISSRSLEVLWVNFHQEKEWLFGLKSHNFEDFWWERGLDKIFTCLVIFSQMQHYGIQKKSHFQAPFQLFFCINQLPTWENDDFWQKKMSDYFFRFSKCSLWSLKILCLTFNYQLISWCFGVCPIFLAICPVNLRYSGPKSAEKWPFPQQNKIQKKILAKILIFFRGPKGAPFDQFRCSQWS